MYLRQIPHGGLPGRSSFQVQRQETSAEIGKKINIRELEAGLNDLTFRGEEAGALDEMAMSLDAKVATYVRVLTTHGPY